MKVTLRQKKQTKKGKISLYLEIYKGTTKTTDGKTKTLRDYEYLKLFLTDKPKTAEQKQQNKETLQLAQKIAIKRQNEIDTGKYVFPTSVKH